MKMGSWVERQTLLSARHREQLQDEGATYSTPKNPYESIWEIIYQCTRNRKSLDKILCAHRYTSQPISKYNCLGKQATSTQAFTKQFSFLIFHCNCFLLIWMLKCSIGLQGQTLTNQIAGEKIQHNSLDAMCCADSTLIIKTIIFLCLKIKILLYLTLPMLDYFCFALPDGIPPLISAQFSFLHLKKKQQTSFISTLLVLTADTQQPVSVFCLTKLEGALSALPDKSHPQHVVQG